MSAANTQTNRPLAVSTPLGADQLILVGFGGKESISQLFSFQLELLADNKTDVAFDKLLGQPISVRLEQPKNRQRYFNGICSRVSQGVRDEDFTSYRMEVVPAAWLLTRRAQSRIFQHLSVPDILKKVFTGLDVSYQIQGTFQPRDYCVQYRETDFNFASRLMEEEGIYYFFTHSERGHKMVVANMPESHPEVPGDNKLIYEITSAGATLDEAIGSWEKTQELRSGKYTLWDHCFEMPDKHLEAEKIAQESVAVGTVTHKLQVGGNDKLEIYDYPGEYAQRFDGVDKGGADQVRMLANVFQDNARTAGIRMQQETLAGLVIQGTSNCRNLQSGHRFTLDRHFNGNGPYVLVEVRHSARLENYRSEGGQFSYHNAFKCIPVALPFRPPRLAPKPFVQGLQTAVVVGPAGEQIFTDKYGRVKAQFHWDRQGKHNADSSCWIRVMQPWAGGGFGAIALPRVGHEVVVAFEEGDPDQPLITGSVYNASQMPPFDLPEHRMFSGIKSNSVGGNPAKNFSGLAFNDTPGGERVALYAEHNMMVNSEHNLAHHVGNYQHHQVGRMSLTTVGGLPGFGGGGSGGGGEGEGGRAKPGFGEWKTSNDQMSAQPGLAGSIIYGVNSQDTVGFMHQVTLGSAYQICINPLGFWGFLPKNQNVEQPLAGMGLRAAYGGNVQLFWGANTQATYGPAISINHGPQINITGKPSMATTILATLVPCLSALYEISYAMMGVNERAEAATAAFGIIAIAATGGLMTSEMIDKKKQGAINAAKDQAEKDIYEADLGLCLAMTEPSIITAAELAGVARDEAHELAENESQLTPADSACKINFVEGTILEIGNHVHLISRKDPTAIPPQPGPSTIYINAAGSGDDGVAMMTGTKGVSVSSGSASLALIKKGESQGETTLQCGDQGKLTLSLGPPPVSPHMKFTPDAIEIDALLEPVKIHSFKSIKLDIGVGSITVDSSGGITLEHLGSKITASSNGIGLEYMGSKITMDATGTAIKATKLMLN
jgi:type VI secretion system secreted protein VgrG